MKELFYIIIGIILLSIGPQLILGAIFTAGIYIFLYAMFKGLFGGGSSGGSGGGSGRDEQDPADSWQGTGNPFV